MARDFRAYRDPDKTNSLRQRGPQREKPRRSGIARPSALIGSTSHQAVAEALHIELANVASPVCGFGLLRADYLATFPTE